MTRIASIAASVKEIAPVVPSPALCDDLMEGVAAISEYLYGEPTPKAVRRTRYLIEKKVIPTFKLGGLHAALKSKLKDAIAGATE